MRPSCWRRITTAAVVAPPSVAAAAPAFSQRRGNCLRAPRAEPQGAPRRRLEADRAPVRLDQRSPQARTSSPAALQCRCQRIRRGTRELETTRLQLTLRPQSQETIERPSFSTNDADGLI